MWCKNEQKYVYKVFREQFFKITFSYKNDNIAKNEKIVYLFKYILYYLYKIIVHK